MEIQGETLLGWIVLLPLLGAVLNGVLGRRLSKRATSIIGCSSVGIAFVLTILTWLSLRARIDAGLEPAALELTVWNWMDSDLIRVNFALMFDQLSAVMTLIITGVGLMIHIFSIGYMHDDDSYHRYFSYLNLFMFSMLCLVLGSNMIVMFLGWEGVGLCSYLLIGFWFTDDQKAQAGQKAFVVNRIGDLGFLVGTFVLMAYMDGSVDFGTLAAYFSQEAVDGGVQPLRDSTTITLICTCLFVGAMGKSAQIPLYIWLPDAMAGPTPVSALIHAATMVTAGIYMITRLSFLFVLSPTTMALIATVGAATALMAATIGLFQKDIKKVLAYSTVSQLGYMFLAVGVGAFSAGVMHLMTHAFFKALLFLGSGAVIHAMHHEQDTFKMGGLRKVLPVTHWTFLIGTMAIAGVPFLSGFFSKGMILHGAAEHMYTSNTALLAPFGIEQFAGYAGYFEFLCWVGLLAAMCTAFYMFRLYFLTFWGDFRGDPHNWDHVHTPGLSMRLPLIVLAVLAAFGGYIDLASWLEPVTARAMEFITINESSGLAHNLLALELAVAGLGIFGAWFMYAGPGSGLPEQLMKTPARHLHRVVYNKYYVDEFFHAVVVRPMQLMSHLLHTFVDRFIIDMMMVHCAPWCLMMTGRIGRYVQNGDIQRYAVAIVLGTAALVYLMV